MSKKQPTFEDAIADLNNITAFNATQHFPLIIAGLNEAASRIRALETKVANLDVSKEAKVADLDVSKAYTK